MKASTASFPPIKAQRKRKRRGKTSLGILWESDFDVWSRFVRVWAAVFSWRISLIRRKPFNTNKTEMMQLFVSVCVNGGLRGAPLSAVNLWEELTLNYKDQIKLWANFPLINRNLAEPAQRDVYFVVLWLWFSSSNLLFELNVPVLWKPLKAMILYKNLALFSWDNNLFYSLSQKKKKTPICYVIGWLSEALNQQRLSPVVWIFCNSSAPEDHRCENLIKEQLI